MKHSVLAPTRASAEALAILIDLEGFDARVVTVRGRHGVIVHCPWKVLQRAANSLCVEV